MDVSDDVLTDAMMYATVWFVQTPAWSCLRCLPVSSLVSTYLNYVRTFVGIMPVWVVTYIQAALVVVATAVVDACDASSTRVVGVAEQYSYGSDGSYSGRRQL